MQLKHVTELVEAVRGAQNSGCFATKSGRREPRKMSLGRQERGLFTGKIEYLMEDNQVEKWNCPN